MAIAVQRVDVRQIVVTCLTKMEASSSSCCYQLLRTLIRNLKPDEQQWLKDEVKRSELSLECKKKIYCLLGGFRKYTNNVKRVKELQVNSCSENSLSDVPVLESPKNNLQNLDSHPTIDSTSINDKFRVLFAQLCYWQEYAYVGTSSDCIKECLANILLTIAGLTHEEKKLHITLRACTDLAMASCTIYLMNKSKDVRTQIMQLLLELHELQPNIDQHLLNPDLFVEVFKELQDSDKEQELLHLEILNLIVSCQVPSSVTVLLDSSLVMYLIRNIQNCVPSEPYLALLLSINMHPSRTSCVVDALHRNVEKTRPIVQLLLGYLNRGTASVFKILRDLLVYEEGFDFEKADYLEIVTGCLEALEKKSGNPTLLELLLHALRKCDPEHLGPPPDCFQDMLHGCRDACHILVQAIVDQYEKIRLSQCAPKPIMDISENHPNILQRCASTQWYFEENSSVTCRPTSEKNEEIEHIANCEALDKKGDLNRQILSSEDSITPVLIEGENSGSKGRSNANLFPVIKAASCENFGYSQELNYSGTSLRMHKLNTIVCRSESSLQIGNGAQKISYNNILFQSMHKVHGDMAISQSHDILCRPLKFAMMDTRKPSIQFTKNDFPVGRPTLSSHCLVSSQITLEEQKEKKQTSRVPNSDVGYSSGHSISFVGLIENHSQEVTDNKSASTPFIETPRPHTEIHVNTCMCSETSGDQIKETQKQIFIPDLVKSVVLLSSECHNGKKTTQEQNIYDPALNNLFVPFKERPVNSNKKLLATTEISLAQGVFETSSHQHPNRLKIEGKPNENNMSLDRCIPKAHVRGKILSFERATKCFKEWQSERGVKGGLISPEKTNLIYESPSSIYGAADLNAKESNERKHHAVLSEPRPFYNKNPVKTSIMQEKPFIRECNEEYGKICDSYAGKRELFVLGEENETLLRGTCVEKKVWLHNLLGVALPLKN